MKKLALLLFLLALPSLAQQIGGTVNIGAVGKVNVGPSGNLPVNCVVGCSAGGGGTSSSFGAAFPATGTAIGVKNGANMVNLAADGSSNLLVNCAVGCGATATFPDNSAFTAGTTPIAITGGWFTGSPTNCTNGSACAPQLTVDRKIFVDAFQGTSPWVVSGSGTFAVTQSTSPWVVSLTSTTITGTVAVTQSTSPWVDNISQFGGTNISTGTGVGGAGIPRVTVSSDSFPATQVVSGTVTANQGTANSAANGWPTKITDGTNVAAVKAASTQAVAADPSLVVQLNPNQPNLATPLNVSLASTTITGTVAVTQSTSPWTDNITQFGGVNLSTGTGASGTGIPRVTISNDSSLAANQSVNVNQIGGSAVGTAATGVQKVGIVGNAAATLDSTVAAGTAPTNGVATLQVYNTTAPAPTAGQSLATQSDSAGSTMIDTVGHNKGTYQFAGSGFTPLTSGVNVALCGSSTKTVRVTKAIFGLTNSSPTIQWTGSITVNKRSTADSAGTCTTPTVVPIDSNDAASTATFPRSNCSVAITPGTAVGVIDSKRFDIEAAAGFGPNLTIPFLSGDVGNAQEVTLRGTAQCVDWTFPANAGTDLYDIMVQWTEE